MRVTPPALALSLALATVSSVSHSQRAPEPLDARSVLLVNQAKSDAAAGRLDAANDAAESALAVDPRNRTAFLVLADIAQRQQLPGKAIRLYRESLMLDPNDVGALAGQGEAMVAKGAVAKARENLSRIKALCTRGCPESARLAAVIEKGPPPNVMSAQATPTATPN